MKKIVVGFILLPVLLIACSHTPARDRQNEIGNLEEQLKATIVKSLNSRPGIKEVKDVKILKADMNDKTAKFTYIATFDTNSDETGLVNQSLESEVTLLKTDEQHWKVSEIEPKNQTVVFTKPMEIVAKKRQ